MQQRALFCAVLALSVSAPSAFAQSPVVYDDFAGTAIDGARWFQFGDPTRTTIAGGYLRLFGRGFHHDFGALALAGLDGDFVIDLAFTGFRAGDLDGSFHLFAFEPESSGAAERGMSIGMSTELFSGKPTVGFTGELEVGGNAVSSGFVPSSATAGELRIQRSGNAATLSFRPAGQSQFTVLAGRASYFSSRYVSFGIDVGADVSDSADVFCDSVTVTGTTVSGLSTYGARCHELGAIAAGYPRIGNNTFRVIVIGGSAYRGDPCHLGIGVQSTAVPLDPAGAPGCTLLTSPLIVLSDKLDSFGEKEFVLPIPNLASLRGVTFQLQVAAYTNRNAMRLAWSNGTNCKVW